MVPWVAAHISPLTVRALLPVLPQTPMELIIRAQLRNSWQHCCTELTGCDLLWLGTSSEWAADCAEFKHVDTDSGSGNSAAF